MSVKTAFSSWNGRIAPVFDVARRLFLVELESGRVLSETEEGVAADEPGDKVRQLAELKVNTLVCGAISRFLHDLVLSYGITVVPFVAGDVREVVQAWIEDRLDDSFAMPGCCGRSRGGAGRCGRKNRHVHARDSLGENGPVIPGQERFPGHVRGVAHDLSPLPEMEGMCVCPRCGHYEPHKAGIPCLHVQCPLCGSMMIRGA